MKKINIKDFIKSSSFFTKIFILSILSWGLILMTQGYYFDDGLWIRNYYIHDRSFKNFLIPFSELRHEVVGIIDFFLISLVDKFGSFGFLLWSIIKFIFILLNAYFIYIILNLLFPNHKTINSLISILYLLSPAVNNIAMVQIPYFLFLSIYLLSIIFFILSLIKVKRFYFNYFISIILFTFSAYSHEAFVFLESLRFIVLLSYTIINNYKINKILSNLIILLLPFFIISVLIFFKTYFFPSYGYYEDVYDIKIISIPRVILEFFNSIQYLFFDVFYLNLKIFFAEPSIFLIFPSISTTILVYIWFIKNIDNYYQEHNFSHYILLVGFFLLFSNLFPYLVTRSAPNFGDTSRHFLTANLGYIILLFGLIFFLYTHKILSKSFFTTIMCSIIFLFSISATNTSRFYLKNWSEHQNLYWQLAWRIPDIKSKTVFMVDMPIETADYFKQYSWFFFDFIYGKNSSELLDIQTLPFETALDHRSKRFWLNKDGWYSYYSKNINPNFNNIILVSKNKSCVKINLQIQNDRCETDKNLPILDNEPMIPNACYMNIEPLQNRINENQIIYRPGNKKFKYRWLIGEEPPFKSNRSLFHILKEKITRIDLSKNWCYYYQKANLALDLEDHNQVENYFRIINDNDLLYFENYSELTPFIQSFYLNQNFTDGKKLLSMWHTSNASIDYNKFYIFKHIYKFGSENIINKFETHLANFQ
ncbi:hypothetical protein OA321_01805 [Pelagibacteraceae bacterium]|nr:hypothetical protein [Pelagibacteraceae bacterium]